jgi:hypothetical protein
MRLLINARKLNDIFELLENERKRSINIFDKLFNGGMEPTIIWNINVENLGIKGFYKESEEFSFELTIMIVLRIYVQWL